MRSEYMRTESLENEKRHTEYKSAIKGKNRKYVKREKKLERVKLKRMKKKRRRNMRRKKR